MAKCNALHVIINSNCLLSILKAPFNIKCHFLSILFLTHTHTHNTFCYSIIEPHHPLIFYLFFYFSNFSSHYYLQKKTKTKTSSSPYYDYTFSNLFLPSLSLYLPHYSVLHHYTSFIIFHNLTLLHPILFVHIYGYTFSNLSLPSLPLYLPHYSLLYCYTSFIIFYSLFYNLTLLLPILFV